MSTIQPTTNERKIHKIELFTKTSIEIKNMPPHPNILFPYSAVKQYNVIILSYIVLANGTTLRDFINKRKQSTRFSFRKIHLWTPNDIMLQIISACEFMVANNLITNQTNINPNNIWIQYNEHGKLCAYVMYNFENAIEENETTHLDERTKNYWAPEILKKHNNARFFEDQETIIRSISVLKRRNTTQSTLQIVYSLGLILYFIVYKEDAFPELRIDETDWPQFHHKNKYTDNIKLAIHPEAKDRMALTQWSIMLQTSPKVSIFKKIYNCCKMT